MLQQSFTRCNMYNHAHAQNMHTCTCFVVSIMITRTHFHSAENGRRPSVHVVIPTTRARSTAVYGHTALSVACIFFHGRVQTKQVRPCEAAVAACHRWLPSQRRPARRRRPARHSARSSRCSCRSRNGELLGSGTHRPGSAQKIAI